MPSIVDLNVSHLHLISNHIPTIGTVVVLALLTIAFFRRDENLKLVGLEVLFAVALLTLPVFISGVAAFSKLAKTAGVSQTAVRLHQDVAIFGFTWLEFAGFIGWLTLWRARRQGRASKGLTIASFVLTVMSLVVMGRAANLGGDIRHPEIASAAVATIDPMDFLQAKISNVMVNSPWAWPASETVHFLGLSLTFGVLLAVNLRILGAMKNVPFSAVHRLLPWGMLGFGANIITGMLFVIGQPKQYVDSAPFYWKIVFLVIAGANFLYLTVFRKSWAGNDSPEWQAPAFDKAMAYVSMFSWLVILYCGRMLPFIGHSF
jgi:hypothetical protein